MTNTAQFEKNMLKNVYVELFPAADFEPEDIECFYVLSTGRCGTATIDRLLAASKDLISFHEPMPRLHRYHISALHGDTPMFIETLVRESRIDLMSAVMSMGLKYAECQHRWTPYAPIIKKVFPKTKFIYLRRDMDGFVQSAYQWHFYDVGKDIYAPFDIRDDETKVLAWHWCYTNEFIINFLKYLDDRDWVFVDFKDIKDRNWNRLLKIYDWLGVKRASEFNMDHILSEELNRGKRGHIKKGWGNFDERAKRIERWTNESNRNLATA